MDEDFVELRQLILDIAANYKLNPKVARELLDRILLALEQYRMENAESEDKGE